MTAFGPHLSRSEALALARRLLVGGGGDAAPGDAGHLAQHALGVSRTDLLLDGGRVIGAAGAARLEAAVERRRAGEPVARILGEWEFWGLPFALSPETLVPRPDTETLVESVLARWPDRQHPLRILDLGTGSGCILIALLTEYRHAFGVGVDRSYPALMTASANARTNGVFGRAAFAATSWCDPLTGPFDVVVANPPYIATATIAGLPDAVRRHDPLLALDGGEDGLDAYRSILDAVGSPDRGLLSEGASVHLEIGYDQAATVCDLARAAGFGEASVVRDLAGHDRVISLSSSDDQPLGTSGDLGGNEEKMLVGAATNR